METTHCKAGGLDLWVYIKPVDFMIWLLNPIWSNWIISSFGLPAEENYYIHEALLGGASFSKTFLLTTAQAPLLKLWNASLIASEFQFLRRQ